MQSSRRAAEETSQPSDQRPSKRRRTSKTSSDDNAAEPVEKAKGTARVQTTVYDAVAGRVGPSGFRSKIETWRPAETRDTLDRTLVAITPTDALLKTLRAAKADKYDPIYNAHRSLSERTEAADALVSDDTSHVPVGLTLGRLPESDLLKAVHAYVSDFWAASTKDKGYRVWKSLDETALLAVGILMEEEVRRLLGNRGWIAFVDQEEISDAEGADKTDSRRQEQKV